MFLIWLLQVMGTNWHLMDACCSPHRAFNPVEAVLCALAVVVSVGMSFWCGVMGRG